MWCLFGDYQPKKLTYQSLWVPECLQVLQIRWWKNIFRCNLSILTAWPAPWLSATVASCDANIAKVQGKVTAHGGPKKEDSDKVINFLGYIRASIIMLWNYRNIIKGKALKCKPSANCTCTILLIDGLGYLYVFTCGLPLVASGVSDTG